MRHIIFTSFAACVCLSAQAQTAVPHTFLPGTPAKAVEVNANFGTLATAINTLAARVDKLDGKISAADLAGTYTLLGYQSEFNSGSGFGRSNAYTYSGTAVLRSDGTATVTSTEKGSSLYFTNEAGVLKSSITPFGKPTETGTVTWTYAGNVVTMFGAPFSVVAGGSLLVTASSGSENTSNILLLTRVK